MDRPLRVLAVDTERTWRGGERQALLLAEGLRRRGHFCLLIARRGSPLHRRATESGLAVESLRVRAEFDPLASHRLVRLARGHGVDLVHAHTAHAHTLCLPVRRRTGLPLVVSRRVDFRPRSGFFSRRKYLCGADHFVAITKAVAGVLVDFGVDRSRISVVASGVDPARLEEADRERGRRALGATGGHLVIGAVGHLAWHKGFEVLVEAARRLGRRRCLFFVAGDGEERADLEARVREAGLAATFRLLGHRDDVPDLIAAADVFVAPSHMEGLNTSILDAMALARPVVATRVGGIPEAVVDGVTGLLVAPGDAGALAAALERLLADEDLRRRMGREGRARALERFTADAMVEGTISVYRRLLERRPHT